MMVPEQSRAGREKQESGEGGSKLKSLFRAGLGKFLETHHFVPRQNSVFELEFRYGWTIELQQGNLQTRLECPEDRSWRPEILPN